MQHLQHEKCNIFKMKIKNEKENAFFRTNFPHNPYSDQKKKKKNSASGIKQQVVWPEIQNLY